MNSLPDGARRFLAAAAKAIAVAGRTLAVGLRRARVWLEVPFNLCLAALSLVFLISLLSWALADKVAQTVLFFPDGRTGRLKGEVRDLPRVWGREARAELIASEVLLGPRDPDLEPAFLPDVRVESTLYRKGRLFIDISEGAALADPASLKLGLEALRRSLGLALPAAARIALTIGGQEPYSEGLPPEPSK